MWSVRQKLERNGTVGSVPSRALVAAERTWERTARATARVGNNIANGKREGRPLLVVRPHGKDAAGTWTLEGRAGNGCVRGAAALVGCVLRSRPPRVALMRGGGASRLAPP